MINISNYRTTSLCNFEKNVNHWKKINLKLEIVFIIPSIVVEFNNIHITIDKPWVLRVDCHKAGLSTLRQEQHQIYLRYVKRSNEIREQLCGLFISAQIKQELCSGRGRGNYPQGLRGKRSLICRGFFKLPGISAQVAATSFLDLSRPDPSIFTPRVG